MRTADGAICHSDNSRERCQFCGSGETPRREREGLGTARRRREGRNTALIGQDHSCIQPLLGGEGMFIAVARDPVYAHRTQSSVHGHTCTHAQKSLRSLQIRCVSVGCMTELCVCRCAHTRLHGDVCVCARVSYTHMQGDACLCAWVREKDTVRKTQTYTLTQRQYTSHFLT